MIYRFSGLLFMIAGLTASAFGGEEDRETTDGNSMALFPHSESKTGITGALAMGESYVPSNKGIRVYFNVKDIDDILDRVRIAGGSIVYPKTSIGDLGWVAEFEDSEGNVLALHATNE